ncbi:bifunctional hydroxymethylpyrimidine kinase/phosphomethylpyrimidine kinase [Neoehrlichia mikurensis]|uniref:hydroxymethylpyrimidine kinase n=1 Tax=Neoehrlichia mikurensis TaxID=89586 RepID=A0A9Q9BRG7_9RICK|nr:bifunctional hydroxymethylpyrimidine kinase/phosphomethylpyrimidine kinase [Neoehrlichia mikurensis]QXK92144.1 bifunctional hydroxymethylpyrimidine kinase/phosphomethylpyrimidine kinase [Neoehrlichia mikurensis]QXK92601.1 bifunctional hydroxymethylpyrimidine kinase/phosphomethylpyrimidine kinase [Neoehrlichia mikurensis]QXK93838.1 bifunctional hydroxymethylpyrimidine kinase/phosphomethylpyrimidine kinase [Neoehrlichia mikurensis]UTO55167.1 bifunctional hydroxymethylpyrimidine kinase/phosphom
MHNQYKGKVLTIAGSDSSGGAGIQADIKTITMLGCYAASCITSVTVQNTLKIHAIHNIPPNIISEQINAIMSDIEIDAIKIGMLPNYNTIKEVAASITKNIPIIFDPVMISTSGFNLVEHNTVDSLIKILFPKITLITPNIQEAETIINKKINTLEDIINASKIIASFGVKNVLIKGGHLPNKLINNIVLTENNEIFNFQHLRIFKGNLHGTGCTLSSAIASFMSQKLSIKESIQRSIDYLIKTINVIPRIGNGFNPVFHNYNITK